MIPIVNKLQEVLVKVGRRDSELELSQVAVAGSQSSGKSSIFEALVGRDFLPRATTLHKISTCTFRFGKFDALQIAGIVDPNGNYTIGVITKLDIMDRGTDAYNLFLGKTIPLGLITLD
ncbi:hypothetical protein L2E82_06478 [Cichorium intybus]|uniref:Uncharacterized protein n=1 Tax=Cichorium intybus TaxID=13427 RepID=A0ACB9HBD0_CICIN|nr:hypothetical protein L2E82_06478 [Cichorium intybus]